MKQNQPQPDLGYTLIELVAVFCIFALTLWIAMPALTGSAKSRTLEDATSAMVSVLDQTRIRAMKTGKPASFSVDPEARSYRTDEGTAVALPRGVALEAHNGTRLVVFHPDGTANDAQFLLRTSRSGARVGIDWLTGRATVAFDR